MLAKAHVFMEGHANIINCGFCQTKTAWFHIWFSVWENKMESVMESALRAKCLQNASLSKFLLGQKAIPRWKQITMIQCGLVGYQFLMIKSGINRNGEGSSNVKVVISSVGFHCIFCTSYVV